VCLLLWMPYRMHLTTNPAAAERGTSIRMPASRAGLVKKPGFEPESTRSDESGLGLHASLPCGLHHTILFQSDR
jgi:hypothetical protein